MCRYKHTIHFGRKMQRNFCKVQHIPISWKRIPSSLQDKVIYKSTGCGIMSLDIIRAEALAECAFEHEVHHISEADMV